MTPEISKRAFNTFRKTIIVAVSLGINLLYAQSFEWAKSIGGTSSENSTSISIDAFGNIYTSGYFQGTADFDPGIGTYNLTSAGATDIYIQKLDSAGNFIWAKQLGGTLEDISRSIKVDDFGNIYTTGFFTGTVDFNPNAGTYNLTSSGNRDIFIFKLNGSGNFIWAKRMGGPHDDQSNSISIDDFGNVLSTGWFQGTVDFDPGSGVFNLTPTNINPEVFIQKLDSSGNFIWAKSMGDIYLDEGSAITVDESGNIYTVGKYAGTVDFNPGLGTNNFTWAGGVQDIFIQKLDSSGSFQWAKSMGGNGVGFLFMQDVGKSIKVDGSGNVYTTGFFQDTVDFDPGVAISNLISAGSIDIFIQKLDSSGNLVWAKRMGGSLDDAGNSIDIDASGNVYTTGYFSGIVDFDPGPGITNLTSASGLDFFIQKVDASGNFLWARSSDSSFGTYGNSLSLDSIGNIYVTGSFYGTTDFNSGSGVNDLNLIGGSDVFVLKMSPCLPITSTDVISVCDSLTWIDGITYTTSNNTASHTLTNVSGCDSIVTLNLTIYYSNYSTQIITACDSYTWIDGNTYTANNNTATQILTNAAGCDSLVTLNLTINNSNSAIDVKTACDSLVWIDGITYYASNSTATHALTNAAGCDSLVTLNLTILSNTGIDIQTACDSFTWIDGNTYYSSNNTAIDTLINVAGCDSIVTLDLTINYSNSGTDVISACDSYTWIDGITYTISNNTASHTLINVSGCDSVVTLDLTINYSTSSTDIFNACDSYTWIDGITYTSSNNTASHTLTNVSGCDSLVTLDLTIDYSTYYTDIQLACDSFTWIDGNTYTSFNNTATFTISNATGCDSLVTLDLTILSDSVVDIQTACDSLTWIDGNTYYSSNNTAIDTLINVAGCDSIVTLNLTINYSNTGTDFITACDSFTWMDGVTYNASNSSATHTLTNGAGCDSLVALDLIINYSSTGTDVITACDSYTWIDGITYTSSNSTASYTLTNASGCDSLVTLDLTINNSNSTIDVKTACDSLVWIDGITYYSSNSTATHALTNAAGCDSVVTLNLTILSNTGLDIQTACDSFTWIDGNTYYSSNNTAIDTLINVAGCDSIVTLDLTINYSSIGTDVITTCNSYTWIDGITYNSSNSTATYTLMNTVGCDSVVSLDLTINYSTTSTDIITACDSYTWIDGITHTSSNNTASHTLTNVSGCDSLVTLDLTINNSNSAIDVQTACDSLVWIDGKTYSNSNNTATFSLMNAAGCDSVVTLNLMILSNTGLDIQTACDSFTWIDGNTYYSSNNTAIDTLINVAGCDSIVTLDLTINYSNSGTDVITACDSYTWIDGITYTSSNSTATYTLMNTVGCDSVVSLDLTINYSTTSTDIITACDSYTWIDGITYTSSNSTASYTLTNAAGCDSLVTLDLTINNSNSAIEVQTACDSLVWIDGITYYSSNNTATHTLTNAAGCDSVVTLDLTIHYSTSFTDIQSACDSLLWIDGNTYFTSNNSAAHTLVNAAGCDSIVTLNLTIYYSNTGTDIVTACDSYTWINGNTYTTSNDTATHTLINAAGCDSVVTLNLMMMHSTAGIDSVNACNEFTWIDGNTYTVSNNSATHKIINSFGCDSIITLNLTVNTISDITTTVDGIVIKANDSTASYRWLNCDSNYSFIPNQTDRFYKSPLDGNFAVEITKNGCVDTSECVSITVYNIEELGRNIFITAYPNPTRDEVNLTFSQQVNHVEIVCTDVNGSIISSDRFATIKSTNLKLGDSAGVYFVIVKTEKGKSTMRLIKE